MRFIIFLLLLVQLIACGKDNPSTGIASNPNFVTGHVLKSNGDISVGTKITAYKTDGLNLVVTDSTTTDEDGNFSIQNSNSSTIEIKDNKEIGLFYIDDSISEYTTGKYSYITASLTKISDKVDDPKNYKVIILGTPYVTTITDDLMFTFDSIPSGEHKLALVDLDEDHNPKTIIDSSYSTISLESDQTFEYIPVFDSIIYIADTTNFIDSYIEYVADSTPSYQPSGDNSKSISLMIGQDGNGTEYKILLNPIFHDTIYALDLESVSIELNILAKTIVETEDTFNYSTNYLLGEWEENSVTSIYSSTSNPWNTEGIGFDGIDASTNTIQNITIPSDGLTSTISIPMKEYIQSGSSNGVILTSTLPVDLNYTLSFKSVDYEEASRPKIKIYFYR